MQKWRLGSGRSFSTSSSWSACWQSRGRPPSWSRWICPPPPVNKMSMYLQTDEMMFLELKNVIWLVVANLFCNMNLLKNSQEMLRNDWLACMMARMIISASSFASAWKVINYQECPAQLFFFNSTSSHLYLHYFIYKFALLPVGQGWGRPSSPGSLPWSSPRPPERKIMIL